MKPLLLSATNWKLVCRKGSGDTFNPMEPSLVARALARVRP